MLVQGYQRVLTGIQQNFCCQPPLCKEQPNGVVNCCWGMMRKYHWGCATKEGPSCFLKMFTLQRLWVVERGVVNWLKLSRGFAICFS